MLADLVRHMTDDAIIIGVGILRSVNAGTAALTFNARADEEVQAIQIRPR
jgi:hypothetical protein